MNSLKVLVMMQLKDKMDLSYLKSPRKTLFKVSAMLGQILLSGVAFYLLFFLSSKLKIFSIYGKVPYSLITALFTLIFGLSLIACTVGLTRTLYLAADNRVLLTLPAPSNLVFFSKFVLYYIFELKKNLMILLPMYVAYGIVCAASWYYYFWLIICYFIISLLPVAISAVLSIPALFASNVIRRHKWLQATLIVVATGLVGWGLFALIGRLPANINLTGRWRVISDNLVKGLNSFAKSVWPLNEINLMSVGSKVSPCVKVFTLDTVWGLLVSIGTVGVCIGLTILLARPLFFKMASSQFEFEKRTLAPKKNRVRSKRITSLVYETLRSVRSSRFVLKQIVSLLLLPVVVFLLNKIYAAMNTALTGQYMTIGFSLLICLVIVTSDNVSYASVYSVDGAARPIAKTQPVNPKLSLIVRLVPRAVMISVSTIAAVCFWRSVAGFSAYDAAMFAFIIIFVGWAHLLWSAEMDIMNPQHDQYATVGMTLDNPNERNSTILAFLISVLVAFVTYFLLSEGQSKAVTKIVLVAAVFLAARAYLYFTRISLYYAEK